MTFDRQLALLFILPIPIASIAWTVTHEEVDSEFLGGAATHTTQSGVAHLATHDEASALEAIRTLLSRMNGPKKMMAEMKAHEGSRVEITGLMKKGQYRPDGISLGGGVRAVEAARPRVIDSDRPLGVQARIDSLNPGHPGTMDSAAGSVCSGTLPRGGPHRRGPRVTQVSPTLS